MPTRSNPQRTSPVEMLTGKSPSLVDIVVFRSQCEVFCDLKKNSLKQRSEKGLIVEKSDETKGFRVWLPRYRIVITYTPRSSSQSLTDEENKQLEKFIINEIKTELAELASLRQDQHASADRQVTATTPSGQLGSQTSVCTDEKRDEPIKNELRRSKRTSKKSLQKIGGGLI
ncbi:unnamed protein product [Peronospora farinosa]|uniref:Uncharacterized protein n=1 Tax=Peronospora farinosa TaxID=134698 RepID=A0ABN8CGA0_9STRA|nr:unnamed protein product [Peronospora farinosa]